MCKQNRWNNLKYLGLAVYIWNVVSRLFLLLRKNGQIVHKNPDSHARVILTRANFTSGLKVYHTALYLNFAAYADSTSKSP
jgi:hypothetical protein